MAKKSRKTSIKRLQTEAHRRAQALASKDVAALQQARDEAMARVAELEAQLAERVDPIEQARAWNEQVGQASTALQSTVDEFAKLTVALLTRVDSFRGELGVLVRNLEQIGNGGTKRLEELHAVAATRPDFPTPDKARAGLGMAFATLKAERDAAVNAYNELADVLHQSAATVTQARQIIAHFRDASGDEGPEQAPESAADTPNMVPTHVAVVEPPADGHMEPSRHTYQHRKNPERFCLALPPEDDKPVQFEECDKGGNPSGKQGESKSGKSFLKSWTDVTYNLVSTEA